MALEVYEIDDRPGVRRLSHPDFQDVYHTSYKKGVITDFKKVSDDPFRTEAMVKVQIEGEDESDYIPIFYQPKAQYWDDTETTVLATDYDTDKEYFKQAWMSFRGGDEAVVLCQADINNTLIPNRVIGFIDNYPRLGENIFKITYTTVPFRYFWQRYGALDGELDVDPYDEFFYMTAFNPTDTGVISGTPLRYILDEEYGVEKVGPDGKDLQLLKEYTYTNNGEQYVVEEERDEWIFGGLVHVIEKDYRYYYFTEFFFVVGPLLLNLQIQWQKTYYFYSYDVPIDPPIAIRENEGGLTHRVRMAGAIYSQTLLEAVTAQSQADPRLPYNRIIASTTAERWNIYDGFTNNPVMAASFQSEDDTNYWPWIDGREDTVPPDATTEVCADWTTAKIYVRPHTNQELIDAGLLNADGTLPEEV